MNVAKNDPVAAKKLNNRYVVIGVNSFSANFLIILWSL